MKAYHWALKDAIETETHTVFVEPTATTVDGAQHVAKHCRVEMASSNRIREALTVELALTEAWLRSRERK